MASQYEFKTIKNTINDSKSLIKTLKLENDYYSVSLYLIEKEPEEITEDSPEKYMVTFNSTSKKRLLLDIIWLAKEQDIICGTSEHFIECDEFEEFEKLINVSRECLNELRKIILPILKGNDNAG